MKYSQKQILKICSFHFEWAGAIHGLLETIFFAQAELNELKFKTWHKFTNFVKINEPKSVWEHDI